MTSILLANNYLCSSSQTLRHIRPTAQNSRLCRASVAARAGLGDFFTGFFDGSWAPKSARVWRKQSYERSANAEQGAGGPASSSSGRSGDEEQAQRALDDLQARINRFRAATPASSRLPPDLDGDASGADATDPSSSPSSSTSPMDSVDGGGFDGSSPPARASDFDCASFSGADDGELAAALNRRIGQIAASTGSYDSVVTEEEMRRPLSATELRQLIYAKYGKTYDVSFVRRDIPGKTFVCLNIMWHHLEQRSFKLTERQYLEKLDGVALLVGALGQTDKVRAFLREPARSQKGLPSRPVVGTAVSIRFDLDPAVIEEWFGRGYQ